MIAVIADDLTGAAELGGIGLRFGLLTEVHTTVPSSCNAELLVIAADTRSKSLQEAVEDMAMISRRILKLSPSLIYKKTDSVLRGHVVAELKVHLSEFGLSRALLVPVNPGLGRVIRDGRYYINGVPVQETAFASDPDFPVRSNEVQEMLRDRDDRIVVGEAETFDDLRRLALDVEPGMLLAGAASFFSVLLEMRRLPVLYVSGTTFESNRDAVRRLFEEGGPVLYMPIDIGRAVELLTLGKLVVAEGIGDMNALELRTRMGKVITELLKRVRVGELIIEGGSTAYAILKEAGLDSFVPQQELALGVVKMRTADGMLVTMKPGSYSWPGPIRF